MRGLWIREIQTDTYTLWWDLWAFCAVGGRVKGFTQACWSWDDSINSLRCWTYCCRIWVFLESFWLGFACLFFSSAPYVWHVKVYLSHCILETWSFFLKGGLWFRDCLKSQKRFWGFWTVLGQLKTMGAFRDTLSVFCVMIYKWDFGGQGWNVLV